MARVLIETYGCTLNQADSDIMASLLEKDGHTVERGKKRDAGGYDYVIVNTCTVKQVTEQKIIYRLGKMKGLGSHLIIAGCMASANRDKIEKVVPNASIVTTSNVTRIADALTEKKVSLTRYSPVDKLSMFTAKDSVIAKIPISEGCLSSCNFCETKFARGPLHSFSEELILKAVRMSVENGAKEIQLASQDTGAYGLDRGTNIAELAKKAAEIPGEFRIRIGMLNPEHVHKYFDALVDAYKSDKVYKFIHLPVQSGSDKVLRDMARRYTVEEFRRLVGELREKVPGISVETDIIVGYPTETDDDFNASMKLVGEVNPAVVNVSRFGARPHTKAAKLKQLSNAVIKERSIRMHRLSRRVEQKRGQGTLSTSEMVLVTEERDGKVSGRDAYYRQIGVADAHSVLGKFIKARITGNSYACLIAEQIG